MSLPPTPITSVILCGGFGTSLWPLLRKLFPKQLIDQEPAAAHDRTGFIAQLQCYLRGV